MSKEITNHNEYIKWLGEIKERIRSSQQRAALKVNQELLSLYWFIGEALATKQTEWGDKFIDNLARDLKVEFPDVTGFSKSNLKYMRRWYSYYTQHTAIGQQLVDQLKFDRDAKIVQQAVAQIRDKANNEIGQQPVDLNLIQLLFCVPWGHHTLILTKTKDTEEALYYIIKTIQNNWSRNVLQVQIESDLYNRQGKALTNFEITLPKTDSDLAKEMLKNPYSFELQNLSEDFKELELERALTSDIKKFLLELGKGFAYVGNQYNLNVAGDDFFPDLLFYNTKLHCYVVIELKIGDFKPEFVGKLNFYQNAIDEQVKTDEDKPTIGVLLCKTPNKTVVEYALRKINSPVGVSNYKVSDLHYERKQTVPKDLMIGLPSKKELEQQLEKEVEIKQNPIDEKLNKLKEIIAKSGKEEIKIEKSNEVIYDVANNVFFPLVDYIEEFNRKELKKLFKDITYEFVCGRTVSKSQKEFRNQLKNSEDEKEGFEFRIRYKGFLYAGTESFDTFLDIQFSLNNYKFSISESSKEKPIREFLYHKMPDNNEIREIADKIMEKEIDNITNIAKRRLEEEK